MIGLLLKKFKLDQKEMNKLLMNSEYSSPDIVQLFIVYGADVEKIKDKLLIKTKKSKNKQLVDYLTLERFI